MDRSSMHKVETTYDREKREAYKAKLASKINFESTIAQEITEPLVFNGVPIGGILVHPSLGEGTLVAIEDNEVLIDFGANGLVGLVASQAKSFVHAPIKKEAPSKDSAFFGEEIQSNLVARDDLVAYKAKMANPVPEVLSNDTNYSPVGSNVWHPDFGLCQIHAIDEKKNSIVLRIHNQDRELDLVLSQVRSKLIPADLAPEHVPVKPFVREPLAKRVDAYKAPDHGVFVTLPGVFNLWQRKDQFLFLTKNQKLTTTEAEDVFQVLAGKTPLFSEVSISWANPTPTDQRVELIGEVIPEVNSPWMVGQRVWHLDLGAATVLSIDSKNIILDFPGHGIIEMILSSATPRLSTTETVTLDHASNYYLAPKVNKATKNDKNFVHPVVLPQAFNSWDEKRKHMYLCSENHLTTDEAAEVLSRMAGNKPLTKTQFEISWDESSYSAMVEAARKTPEETVVPERVITVSADSNPRSVEEVEVAEKKLITTLSVTLPLIFKIWTVSDQYTFLTKTLVLPPNDAQDIIDIVKGHSLVAGGTVFDIAWDTEVKDFTIPNRVVEEVEVIKKETAAVKLSVSLPEAFKSWRASDQFFFLSRTKHLTANESNDVMAILDGKKPVSKNVLFEIRWDD